MFVALFFGFFVMTIIEIFVLIKVGSVLGVLPTLALIITISLVGAWLAKREGFAVLARVRAKLDQGRMPGDELLDGMFVVAGGILLVTPGFVTDALGLLVLFPPTRYLFRLGVKRYLSRRVEVFRITGPARAGSRRYPDDDVIDI